MNQALAVALVSLLASVACACACKTQERPPASSASSASNATSATSASRSAPLPLPLPLPETAFRDEGADQGASGRSSPPPASRFETRRIGPSDDDDGDRSDPFVSRRFHGPPVDLDLKSADLANVFRLLADIGHVNIVVAGDISGTVTLLLKRVPWDQALDLVARTHGLELHREGNVIVVRAGAPHS